jgi:hypothetical protein
LIVLDVDCTDMDSDKCHDTILISYPKAIGISHIKNNHIVCIDTDYDEKGMIDEEIHTLCRQLGGAKRLIDKEVATEDPIETNKHFSKVQNKITL